MSVDMALSRVNVNNNGLLLVINIKRFSRKQIKDFFILFFVFFILMCNAPVILRENIFDLIKTRK